MYDKPDEEKSILEKCDIGLEESDMQWLSIGVFFMIIIAGAFFLIIQMLSLVGYNLMLMIKVHNRYRLE